MKEKRREEVFGVNLANVRCTAYAYSYVSKVTPEDIVVPDTLIR